MPLRSVTGATTPFVKFWVFFFIEEYSQKTTQLVVFNVINFGKVFNTNFWCFKKTVETACSTLKVVRQTLPDEIPIKVHGTAQIEHRRSTRSFGFTGRREHSTLVRPSVLAPIQESCSIEFPVRLCFICKKDDEIKIRSLDWFNDLKRKRFVVKCTRQKLMKSHC